MKDITVNPSDEADDSIKLESISLIDEGTEGVFAAGDTIQFIINSTLLYLQNHR